MPVTFNVIISGTSVSGDLDTTSQALTIQMANSDRIGYVHFMLQNKNSAYAKLTGVSGDATISIDAIPASGITQTMFRGNIELVEPMIDVQAGSQVEVHAYDNGQELLGVISPDARIPSIVSGGVLSLVSGEQGISASTGMDLAIYVSGINFNSGATVSSYMAQFFGRSGDSSGSFSGSLFSFKPHISGYTWKTFYYPDASGGVIANDNNVNYWIPLDTHKVKREYAWDALRRLTRQGIAVDRNQKKVALECYIGVSGDIHVFTSGSYEFIASGVAGVVTLQYYATGQSGSTLNNIVKAKLPNDTTGVKNEVIAWFPAQTVYPLDKDTYTDLVAYSGGYWSGASAAAPYTSGNTPGSSIGFISIMARGSGSVGAVLLNLAIPNSPLNIAQYNASGVGGGVSLNFRYRVNTSGLSNNVQNLRIVLTDTSGINIMKSGGNGSNFAPLQIIPINSDTGWLSRSDVIYNVDGSFNSGTGTNSGWNATTNSGYADLTRISSILIGLDQTANLSPRFPEFYIDNLYFSFNYPFSPVVAFNSGSQGMYGRRYAVVEYPFPVSILQASGMVTHDLTARMGSKSIGDVTIKDNPNSPQSAQLSIKPGQVVVIDAPSMNTGSGQTFYYWRAIDVTHEWSTNKGFITNLRVVPWFSGTLVDPNSNLVDYQLPLQYVQPQPPPDRNLFMPGYPYATLV